MKTLEELLEQVQDEGFRRGAVVYELLNRNAGWGVFWHEDKRVKGRGRDAWREGLVVYTYKPTLREALESELERFAKSEEANVAMASWGASHDADGREVET